MENKYILMTDSNSEIFVEWADKYDIKIMLMPYVIDDEEFEYDLGRNTDNREFYDKMRAGVTPKTVQRNIEDFKEFWKPYLEAGQNILYVGFSSKLSGTFDCATIAREEILKDYSDRKIILVDTLAISGPLSLLILECAKLREQGKSMEDVAQWVEFNKHKVNAVFCVEDLVYLKRGGRLSGAAAFFGTLVGVKPLIYVDPEGRLVPLGKCKGRKKSLKMLADVALKHTDADSFHFIHADCLKDAEYTASLIKEVRPDAKFVYNYIGPVIGSHVGPGTVGICYYANDRKPVFKEGKG